MGVFSKVLHLAKQLDCGCKGGGANMKDAILFNHQKWTAVSQRTYVNGFWQAAKQISHLKIRQCVEKEKITTQMSLGAHKHLHKEEKVGKRKAHESMVEFI